MVIGADISCRDFERKKKMRERKRRERVMRELIRELPAMMVIGAGMFAWAFLLWIVAP